MIVWNMASAYLYASPLKANLGGTTDLWATEGVQFVVAKGLYGPEIAKASDGTVDYRSKEPMLRKEAAALLSTFADNLY